MRTGHKVLQRLALAVLLAAAIFAGRPAVAQQMHDDGIPLPWFHSRAEQIARQACEDDLPECRPSVREQLLIEKTISQLAPWVLLCLLLWGAVRYVRRREIVRERKREEAARHHVRASQRVKQPSVEEAEDEDSHEDADAEEGLGIGTPAGKSRVPRR